MSSSIDELINIGFNGIVPLSKIKSDLLALKIDDSIKFCAIRMLSNWKLFNENEIYQLDFELSLRDYLLLTKKPIYLPSYALSKGGNEIGLFINEDKIWCKQIYPEFINQKFVNRTFEYQKLFETKNTGCFLNASNLVRNMTKFKMYKSEEQKLCVSGALSAPNGYTTLISMSTGGGKSLVTQSLVCQNNDGLTVVVVPTISLMIDQYKNAQNILNLSSSEITLYHSKCNFNDLMLLLNSKKLKMLFISPETLIKNNILKDKLFELANDKYLKNIVIDEAHIIFEWGDSFRLDFQCLDVFISKLRQKNNDIRVFLLSATFKQQDVKYLRKMYCNDDKWLEFRCDSLRKEIQYSFIEAENYYDKNIKMLELVKKLPHPMIIYVNRPEEADNVKKILENNGINNTRVFTGLTGNDERNKLIDKWKNDEFNIMIATCAFGVGVDKKDVRTVLHLYIPDNASKFYQEAGRGGRDGKAALSVLLYTVDDFESSFSFIKKKVLTSEKIYKRWFSMIESPKSIRYGGGIAKLDTTIVPSYSDDDVFITKSNSKHVDWNVYVILFLKRHDLIDVIDVEFSEDKYYLTVQIKDNDLFGKNDRILKKIDAIRCDEWNESESTFNDMKKAILTSRNNCIGDLFLKTYPLITSEFCAGCNNHTDIIYSRYFNQLPLVSSSKYIKDNYIKMSENYSVLIIRNDDINIVEEKLCNKGVSTFVQITERFINSDNNNKIFSYFEFYKLLEKNTFFFSSDISFECPDNDKEILNLLSALNKLISIGIKPIIITKDNYYIESKGKYLNELIESSYKEFYMMEKELI